MTAPGATAGGRTDPARVRAAAARVALANRRAGWLPAGRAAQGRGLGRRARALPPLAADIDAGDPLLAPAIDAAAEDRVFAAAAAALASHRLALAVTAPDRAEADALVDRPARDFALRRRHLSLPLGGGDLPQALAAARMLAQAEWIARLPEPLAGEYAAAHGHVRDVTPVPAGTADETGEAGADPQAAPATAPPPARGLRGRIFRRSAVVVPANPAAVPAADRPARALDEALALFAAPPDAALNAAPDAKP